MSKDLDINNYTYSEMLGLFNIPDNFEYSNKLKMEDALLKISQNLTADYYYFYLKVYTIINVIYGLYAKNVILDTDPTQIYFFVKKINDVF